jgi:hypothetical protein
MLRDHVLWKPKVNTKSWEANIPALLTKPDVRLDK